MKKTFDFLLRVKATGRKLASLTAYDYPTAKLLDDVDLDFLLVGDSLGMVVLGYPDTTGVRMEDMLHHTRAVARGATKTWIVADLPAGSHPSPEAAVENSALLIEAGADAVKIEGGKECLRSVLAIRGAGIPVVGHLGMLPQRVREEGGYHIKGRSEEAAANLLADAKFLDEAGVSAIVLELVHPPVAERISQSIRTPTIGIGSGSACDGQILVLHDVIGLFPWFRPRFAQPRADLASEVIRSAEEFVAATRSGSAVATDQTELVPPGQGAPLLEG
ncbi:MAG: 3-methyl-2-oxobutanoate hydroxymethyltransferase [Chthoniobacterales bacterium]|nr:3-methyl-2-oxobutanoate hydroxymethyltransferase [Chthoniobacterales bacterium]